MGRLVRIRRRHAENAALARAAYVEYHGSLSDRVTRIAWRAGDQPQEMGFAGRFLETSKTLDLGEAAFRNKGLDKMFTDYLALLVWDRDLIDDQIDVLEGMTLPEGWGSLEDDLGQESASVEARRVDIVAYMNS